MTLSRMIEQLTPFTETKLGMKFGQYEANRHRVASRHEILPREIRQARDKASDKGNVINVPRADHRFVAWIEQSDSPVVGNEAASCV